MGSFHGVSEKTSGRIFRKQQHQNNSLFTSDAFHEQIRILRNWKQNKLNRLGRVIVKSTLGSHSRSSGVKLVILPRYE